MEKAGYSLRDRSKRKVYNIDEDDENSDDGMVELPPAKKSKLSKKDDFEKDPDFEGNEGDLVVAHRISPKKGNKSPRRQLPNVRFYKPTANIETYNNNKNVLSYGSLKAQDEAPLNKFIKILPKNSNVKPIFCCVERCITNRKDDERIKWNGKSVVIYPFPVHNRVALNLWIKAVKPNNPTWSPSPAIHGVCSLHFSIAAKPWLGDPPTLNFPSNHHDYFSPKIIIPRSYEEDTLPVKPAGLPRVLPVSSFSNRITNSVNFSNAGSIPPGGDQGCIISSTSSSSATANKQPVKIQIRPNPVGSTLLNLSSCLPKVAQIVSKSTNSNNSSQIVTKGINTSPVAPPAKFKFSESSFSPGIRIISTVDKSLIETSQRAQDILQKRNLVNEKADVQDVKIQSSFSLKFANSSKPYSNECNKKIPVRLAPATIVPSKARKSLASVSVDVQKSKEAFEENESGLELTSVSSVLKNVYSSISNDLLPGITVESDSDQEEVENELEPQGGKMAEKADGFNFYVVKNKPGAPPILPSQIDSGQKVLQIGNRTIVINKAQFKQPNDESFLKVPAGVSSQELSSVSSVVKNVLVSTSNDVLPGITIQSDDEADDYAAEQTDNDNFNQSTLGSIARNELIEDTYLPSRYRYAPNEIIKDNLHSPKVCRFGSKKFLVSTSDGKTYENVIQKFARPNTNVARAEDSAETSELEMPHLMTNSATSLSRPDPEEILGRYLYTGPRTFYCSMCCLHLTNCTRSDICKHVCSHKAYKTLYDCRFCGSVFDTFKFLFCHWKRNDCWRRAPRWLSTLSGALSKCWVCFVCGMKHTQSECSSLTHHVELMHAELPKVFPTVVSPTFYIYHPLDLTCPICSYKSLNVPLLFWHIGSVHNHLCDVFQSDTDVSLKYLDEHLDQDRHRGTTPCTCKHTFNGSAVPKPKRAASTSEVLANFLVLERYKHCSECSTEIAYLHQLLSHTYTCHNLCSLCSIVTYDFWSTAAHKVFRHWLEKCPFCGDDFGRLNRQTILLHLMHNHKMEEHSLSYDFMLGFPTPLLFESSRIYYCPRCQDNGLFLYFASPGCLNRYHTFMYTKYGMTHRCLVMVGNAEGCIKKRLCDDVDKSGVALIKKIKTEPPENESFVSSKVQSRALAHEWELQNAIRIVDEEEDGPRDDESLVEESLDERQEDEIVVLPVEKPTPVFVDLAAEEPKPVSLATQISTRCWCLKNLHKRTVEKNRAWALRLNMAEWQEPRKCALCKRKARTFLKNVAHVCDHFKCMRHFCDRCGKSFTTKRGKVVHSKMCSPKFLAERQMLVLVKPLEDYPEDQYPVLNEIEYINSLGIIKIDEPETQNESAYEKEKEAANPDAVCHYRGCSKSYSNWLDLSKHIVDMHLAKRWKNTGQCFWCVRDFKYPLNLRRHLITDHWSKFRPPKYRRLKWFSRLQAHFCRLSDQKKTKPGAKKFQCKFCKLTMKSQQQLKQHFRIVHPKKYFCWKCLADFTGRKDCFQHTHSCRSRTVIGNNNSDLQVDEKLRQIGMDRSKKTCALCPMTFDSAMKFRGHLRLHCCRPLAMCQKCGQVFFQYRSYLHHVQRKVCASTLLV